MGRKKIEMKSIEDSTSWQVTFSKRRDGMFKKAEVLAKVCNAEVGILLSFSTGRPYVYGSPCFNSVAARLRNPYPRRSKSSTSASLRQARILKSQAKLDRLTKDLERHKELEKVLKKRQEESLENYGATEIIDLKLEELTAFKEKLEDVRDNMKLKCLEMEAMSSLLMLSKNKKN